MTNRLLTALLVAIPLVSAAAPTKKQQAQAKEHIEKAMKAHADNKFDVALVELQAAYKVDPQPDLLFAIGQVYVKLGKCDEASKSYEKFLAANSDPQAKSVVQQAIAACKSAEPPVADKPPDPPPDPPKPDPVVAQPDNEVPKTEPKPAEPKQVATTETPFSSDTRGQTPEGRPWYKDAVGVSLVAGGVVALVVGGVIYSGARADLDDAESAGTLAQYDDLVDQAKSKRTTSVILFGGGAALVGAGVVRYMLRDSKKSSRTVGMVPAPGGGFVTMTGRF